jgi:LysR family transcriptional activator of nhaA
MNYKHLHYFWTVLRTGSIARASEQLHLTPQTLSGQIKQLEERLGKPLLRKAGRGLEATEAGRMVQRYADEIFTLGSAHAGGTSDRARRALPVELSRGVVDSVPKSIACHVLEPCLASPQHGRLVCHEGKLTALLAELAVHRLDLVISDVPLPASLTDHQPGRGDRRQPELAQGRLRGPVLLEDFILREKITHFDHERIPERIVHARGSARTAISSATSR